MRIRETYGGRWPGSYIKCEPEVTLVLETSHYYPYSNLSIEYECTIAGDTIRVDLTGITSPYVVQPSYGPARAGIMIHPEPGNYTVLLKCHKSTDVFSVEVSDLSIGYIQESHNFVASDPELVWRIRENSFYLKAQWYSPGEEWIILALHDSLVSMDLFEEFDYPDGGILPYDIDCSECGFFLYDSEEDFTAACEMLGRFMQDPLYSEIDFLLYIRNWTNIYCTSYDH